MNLSERYKLSKKVSDLKVDDIVTIIKYTPGYEAVENSLYPIGTKVRITEIDPELCCFNEDETPCRCSTLFREISIELVTEELFDYYKSDSCCYYILGDENGRELIQA
jgi:hypothetical protein